MTHTASSGRTLLFVFFVVAAGSVPVGADGGFDPLTVGASSVTASTVADSPSGSFGTRVVRTARGDVISISINNAKNHEVTLGSPDSGFELTFTVTGGGATVSLNTFKAGRSSFAGEWITTESGAISNVQLQTPYISAPLEPGYYPMKIEFNGTESDVGGFVVENRTTRYSAGWAVPSEFEFGDKTTVDSITQAGQNRTTNLSLAQKDWLALEINATGLYGILEKDGAPVKSELDGDNGISVSFVEQNPPPNTAPNEFEGDDAEHLYTDAESGRLFLLIDTDRHDIEPGDVYNATFRVTPVSGLVDREENLTTTFQVSERMATIDYRGRKLNANASGKTTINGSTTMVAGTAFQIRAKHEGQPPFLEVKQVTVDENGTFETTFDFSTIPMGTNFTIRVPETGLTVPAVVREFQQSTPTPTPTLTPTATPNVTTRAPTETPTPTVTPTLVFSTNTPLSPQTVIKSQGQPGFGVIGLLTALLAAVLVAHRTGRWW